MADSDEEYDRGRRRDKFRRERSDYQEKNTGGRRDEWQDNRDGGNFWNSGPGKDRMASRPSYGREYGRDYPNSGGQRRERYSGSPGDRSDMSPPSKRGRGKDYDDSNYDNYGGRSGAWQPGDNPLPLPLNMPINYGLGANQGSQSNQRFVDLNLIIE